MYLQRAIGTAMIRWFGLLLASAWASSPAWAAGTATPGTEPQGGWRDAVTLGIAVFGALLGVLNLLIGIWREKQKRSADGTYHAMRVAVVLEAYAAACSELIYANRHAHQPYDEQYPDWDVKLPKMPAYPEDDAGWKAVDPNTASECLGFGNEIGASQDSISITCNYDEEAVESVVRREACARGLQAWRLAVKLRRAHGLKSIEPRSDYAGHLEQEQQKDEAEIAAEQGRREARAAAKHAELLTNDAT